MNADDFVTLQQAIEYIVFRDFEFHAAELVLTNTEKMNNAEELLWRAVIGDLASIYIKNNNRYTRTKLNAFSVGDGCVISDHMFYQSDLDCRRMLFNKGEIIKNFPSNKVAVNGIETTNDYTTPYLEIMKCVIKQENINAKNQSKIEYLKDIIRQKMQEFGLPRSQKLCESMATIIRLPESQNGRRRVK